MKISTTGTAVCNREFTPYEGCTFVVGEKVTYQLIEMNGADITKESGQTCEMADYELFENFII